MGRNKFILIDEQRRENAIAYIKGIDIGVPVEVNIKPYKKNRTNSQNSVLWMWYKPLGNHLGYTSEQLHEVLKIRFLGIDEKTIDGELIRIPKSTTKLKTKEMAEFLTKVEILARSLNVTLPYPDDYKYAMFLER